MATMVRSDWLRLAAALGGVAAATLVLGAWLRVTNASIVSTTF
jgi:hypothetical protein